MTLEQIAPMDPRQRTVLDRVRVNAPARMLHEGLINTFIKNRIRPEIGLDARALLEISGRDFRSMAAVFDQAELSPSAHGPFLDLGPGALDKDILDITRRRLDRALDVAAMFQPGHIVFHPDFEWWRHEYNRGEWLGISLDTWLPVVRRAVSLGIRPVFENTYERNPADMADLLTELAAEGAGFCLDTGHANAFGQAPLFDWLDALAPYLAALHLHDNHGQKDEHLALGRGDIDFPGLLDRLGRDFPQQPAITLEPHLEADFWPGLARLTDLWPWGDGA